MSPTSSAPRAIPALVRWLLAGGDPSQPDSGQSMRPAPLDTLQTLSGCLFTLFPTAACRYLGHVVPGAAPASNAPST